MAGHSPRTRAVHQKEYGVSDPSRTRHEAAATQYRTRHEAAATQYRAREEAAQMTGTLPLPYGRGSDKRRLV